MYFQIQQIVTIGGPDDGVIEPWQSAHFENFYPESDSRIAPVGTFDFYKKDTFGLKTADNLNKWKWYNVKGIQHSQWIRDEKIIENLVLPYLTWSYVE